MTRRLGLGIVLVVWWALLLTWAAGVTLTTPWTPARAQDLSQEALSSVLGGSSRATAAGMEVSDLGDFDQALQSWRLTPPIAAGDYRWLRYRLANFPRTLELDLIVRTEAHPEDVSVQRLPWPEAGEGVFDLASLPAWQGKVIEIGFSEIDAGGVLPPWQPFQPFVIGSARLESPSWSAAFERLAQDWFGYQPTALSQINVVHAGEHVVWRRSPVFILALGVLGTLVGVVWLGGWPRSRVFAFAAMLVLAAWLALDLNGLQQWHARNQLLRASFAGKPWSERAPLTADRDLQQSAGRIRQLLAAQPAGQHVLLWVPGSGQAVRLAWFLRPLNVSVMSYTTPANRLADGTLLLVDNSDRQWHFDTRHSRLVNAGPVPPAARIFNAGFDNPEGSQEAWFEVPGDLVYQHGNWLLLSVRKGAAR